MARRLSRGNTFGTHRPNSLAAPRAGFLNGYEDPVEGCFETATISRASSLV
jgi:hypothetical protein